MCTPAAIGLSQSRSVPSPSQEQLQEQAAQVAASTHSWRGSNPEQLDVPFTVANNQALSAPNAENAAVGATQQQPPADLGNAEIAAAAEAAVDNVVNNALAAVAERSLTDDVAPSEAAVDDASAAATDSETPDAPQEDSSQYLRPLSPGSAQLEAAQQQRQGINNVLAAAGSSAAAPQADSSQRLWTRTSDKPPSSPANLQQPDDLTSDLAASEAAVDGALAVAADSLTADAPHPDSSQHLRTQISDNALLNTSEEQQASGSTEHLAASEAAVDSAVAAAADSLTADVPQLNSMHHVRPLSPGSALLRAAQLQRRAIDNALAAAAAAPAGAGADSMRSRDSELSAAEQMHLTNELTRSKAAVEAALTEAREGEPAAAAAADTDWSSVQGQREYTLPLTSAPNSQLPAEEAYLESAKEDPSAPAAPESAPASVDEDSVAFSLFAAPTDLSPMAAERIKAAIAQGAGLAPPTSSSSDSFLTSQTAEDIAVAAAEEDDQAVPALEDDTLLSGSLADAAAEDIDAAAGEAADEAPSGSGAAPHGQWVSDPQSGLGMGNSSNATPARSVPSAPQVGLGAAPPAELSQELAADLQEIEALRSQVRMA